MTPTQSSEFTERLSPNSLDSRTSSAFGYHAQSVRHVSSFEPLANSSIVSDASDSSRTSTIVKHNSNTKNNNSNNPIKVICRFRPENEWELKKGKSIVEFPDTETVTVHGREFTNNFTFDRVFEPHASQLDVYQFSISDIVDDLLNGYNGTVLAYGQTGSGKSHTIMGPTLDYSEKGIVPRISEEIFARINNGSADMEYTVAVSFMEIYMEQIKDLIDISHNDNPDYKFEIHEDKTNGIYVTGLYQPFVTSEEDIIRILSEGLKYRSTSSTNMNLESSRSHTIFELKLVQKHIETEVTKRSRLFLVDLAGSEKVAKTGSQGQTLQEAKKINSSLSTLGNVINALTDGKSKHVPYRDSKLTRILQESLGGNSRTSLIINCSPSSFNELETISTLRFGTRAKFIKNKAHVNTELSPAALKNRVAQLEKLNENNQMYIKQLEQELATRRSSSAAVTPSMSEYSPSLRKQRSMGTLSHKSSNLQSRLPVLSVVSSPSVTSRTNEEEIERRDKKIEELENVILNLKVQNLRSSHSEESKLFSLENSLHNISNKLNEVELININLRKHLLISEKIIESRDTKIQRLKVALRDQQSQISQEALGFRNRLGEIQLRLEELNRHKQEELSIQRDLLLVERSNMATPSIDAAFGTDDIVTISDVDPDPSLIDIDDENNSSEGEDRKVSSSEDETSISPNDNLRGRDSIGVVSTTSTALTNTFSEQGFSIYSSKRLNSLNSPKSEKTSIHELESDIINFQQEYVSIGEFLKESRRKFTLSSPTLGPNPYISDEDNETSSMSAMFEEIPNDTKHNKRRTSHGFNLKIVKPVREGSLGPLKEVFIHQKGDNGILRIFETSDSDQVSCREFENQQELLNSKFWKDLQKKKNKEMAKSTIILLKDRNTTYHFDESEWAVEEEEDILEPVGIAKDNSKEYESHNQFKLTKRPREITLVELSFGFLKPLENIVPLTGCITMANGSPSIYQTYSHVLYFALPPEISVKGTAFLLSAMLSVGSYGLTLSYERDSTIICKASPGKPVQIFRKEKYASFSKAKFRKVKFRKRFKHGDSNISIQIENNDLDLIVVMEVWWLLRFVLDCDC
ncbi:Kinesin heavy chain [Spathaspora sp. JA1]|nr:Kinesin heavy chain [Spathaspora sp. JA1]